MAYLIWTQQGSQVDQCLLSVVGRLRIVLWMVALVDKLLDVVSEQVSSQHAGDPGVVLIGMPVLVFVALKYLLYWVLLLENYDHSEYNTSVVLD
jgi:hypothetical protein